MTSKVPFYLLIALLLIIGVGLSIVRHTGYNVPWTPGKTQQVWDIEARVEFQASGDPVKVSLSAPDTQNGFTLIEENASSPGYGINYVQKNGSRRAEWSIREATGKETIYYKVQFLVDPNANAATNPPTDIEDIAQPIYNGSQEAAVESILAESNNRSADAETLAREIIKQVNDPDNQNAALLLNDYSSVDAITKLLSTAGIHNKAVGVIELENGRRRQSISKMVQIWSGEEWLLFDPENNQQNDTQNLLIWDQSNTSLLDVMGGRNSDVFFSMIQQDITPKVATDKKVLADNLLNFSIHSLPLAEQSMFKTIMLIPIGALIVVFLRVIIGLKTSGTFMPVLIAVAFVQTQLLTGIVGFLLIVGTGLIIRGYLSRLNLLLVARISAVIITVILIISLFTIVSFNMGLTEGLTITFFPMIILSWTIERMSILWEEEGAKEVLKQGGGSLFTAVLIYIAMTSTYVQHITFNFIGMQFIILALILALGNYTGYRLTELRRFKPLAED